MRKTMLFVCALFIFAIAIPFAFAQVASIEEEKSSAGNDVISGPSTGLSDLEKSADQAFLDGRYEDAALAMKKLVQLCPDKPELYMDMGLACYHAGHFEEAISAFQEALNRAPSKVPLNVYIYIGIVYDAMGDHEKAKESVNKGLEESKKKSEFAEILIVETLLKKLENK
jgi:tetratricopeptide (TPR) repeat protein